MAVTHVASTTFASTGHADTSLTNSVPAGTVDGDLLLWTIGNSDGSGGSSPTPATPSGWAVWVTSVANGTLNRLTVFYRWASSEPASYTLTGLGANGWTGIMSAFRGVNTTTPQDVAPVTAVGGTSPNITTTCDGCLIVEHGGCNAPSGVTETWTSTSTIAAQTSQTQGAAQNASVCVATQVKSNTGTISPNALTGSSVVTGSAVRVTSALRPAAPAHVSTRDVLAAASAATVTGTYPSTPNQGSLLVATLFYTAAPSIGVMPAGWTLVAEQATGSVAADGTVGVWWKIAGASEPTGVTATATGASVMRLALHEYRNVAAASPVETSGVTSSGASAVTTLAAAALTLANTDDLLFAAYGWNGGTSAPAVDSGLTLRTAVARLADADASSVASGIAPTLTWTTAQRAGSVAVAFKSSATPAGGTAAGGTASVSVTATGDGSAAGAGSASVAVTATGGASTPAAGTGSVTVAASGSVAGTGTATASVTVTASGTARAGTAGTATVAVTASGAPVATTGGSATVTVTGSGAASGGGSATGSASVAVTASGTTQARAGGTASVTVAAAGAARGSAAGTGTITLTAGATGRAVVVGTANISLTAAGAIAATAGGTAQVVLTATGGAHGGILRDIIAAAAAVRPYQATVVPHTRTAVTVRAWKARATL